MKTQSNEQSTQQAETQSFFHEKAQGWDDKVAGKDQARVNVQQQRHDYILDVIANREVTKYALDIGCGVGDLVIAMAEKGIHATGLDFAQGMIDIAHKRLTDSPAETADFIAADYFDWHVQDESYDLIAANGFVEYISFEQRDAFLQDAMRGLRPGGSLVVSSRNRLFNLFSMNDFTARELADDTVEALLLEAMALVKGSSVDTLMAHATAPLPDPAIEYSHTGVGVKTRYQYTPVQLMQIIGGSGFEVVDVSPIHVHGMVPSFKATHGLLHSTVANAIQEAAANQHELLPNASAFMLHARKSET